MKKTALIQHIKKALFSAASLLFGINEMLFIFGMFMLYFGLAGIWSRYGALTVCGGVLVVIGVWGAASSPRKGTD